MQFNSSANAGNMKVNRDTTSTSEMIAATGAAPGLMQVTLAT